MLRKICLSCLLLCVLPNSNAQQASSLEVAERINAYRSDNEKQILQDFVELLSLPNDSINLADMAVNAEHIENLLQQRGFETLRLEAGRAPYVFGELLSPGATETLLLYAHFDGQPTQIENWVYPPFTPTLLDAPLSSGGTPIDMNVVSGRFDPEWRLYARSAGDDKMPVIALIHVLDAMRQNGIPLSVT